ncbi:MAG: serine/threonine protein kinase [Planctomycetes bacterium]|nr:serine/threonine protein kinase [Planctomycetota bacterium]
MFTLDTEKPMTIPPAEPESDERPKSAMRYTYASGSTPLPGYTIKRGVGRGGFGEVYFAVSDAGKEVALKLIRRNLEVELRGVTQCLNLKHQNLIALYDIRTDEYEDRWVVMEYVAGESLEDAIDRHPNGMPVELATQWFVGIATGVAYLHDHGIVHRDLKPANIFLDESTVKIGDYGLSKFISCSRRSGQTESVGTVHYMAPEIANGRYGKEIDTYALGIILYEMLTGHVPFEGESVGEVLMKHLTAEPDLDALEEPYRGIVRGTMAKDPDMRIKNVSEMIERLPGAAGVAGVSASAAANGHPVNAAAGPSPNVGAAANAASHADQGETDNEYEEEPILAGIREGWRELDRRFHESRRHPLIKAMVLFLIVSGLFVTTGAWLPVLIWMGLIYLVYRALWAVVVGPPRPKKAKPYAKHSAPYAAAAVFVAKTSPGSAEKKKPKPNRSFRRQRRRSWQQQLHEHLAAKPLRERVTELVGGMLLAAAIATVSTFVVCSILVGPASLELFVWAALTVTISVWAIMVPAKLLEGKVEDQSPMRFIQLVLGALVGMVVWGIGEVLLLDLPHNNDWGITPGEALSSNVFRLMESNVLWRGFHSGAIEISLQGCVAYFAFLFVILAWWRQAESSRNRRVSLWAVVWCGFVAWLLHLVWWFPQPAGILLAAVIAFTLQLSSSWLPPTRRQKLAEQEV